MGPIRNPNWSTSGMRVTLSYLRMDLPINTADQKENKDILIYHFPCPPCWDVGNSSYEHQFNPSVTGVALYIGV